MNIKELTDDNVEKYIFKRLREKDQNGTYLYSSSQFKKVYSAVKQFAEWCILKEYIKYNPTRNIQIVTTKSNPKEPSEPFTKEEERAFIKLALTKDTNGQYVYRYGIAHVLQMQTGLREGELVGLKWSDINLQDKFIIVNNTTSRVRLRDEKNPQKYTIKTIDKNATKTNAGDNRYIPLTDTAIYCLNNIKTQQLKENLTLPDYILTTTKGTRVHLRYYHKSFKKMIKKLDFNHKGTHTLRKTFGTRLFEQNVPILVISKLLGHSSTTVTEQAYITVIEEIKRKAGVKLNEIYSLDRNIDLLQ